MSSFGSDAYISSQLKQETRELMKNRYNSEWMDFFSNPSSTKLKLGMGLEISTKVKVGMAFEEHCVEEMGLPSCNRSVNGVAKHAVDESIPQLDISAVGSCYNSIKLFHNQCGFGSQRTAMRGFEPRTSSDDNQDGCPGFLTSFRPTASTNPEKQPAAQLTIFYGGTVYVFDDIAADEAHAIILRASSANHSSYLHTKVENGCRSLNEQKISFPPMKWEGSGIDPQPANPKVHTGSSDIPTARKHSLQRFVEKRQAPQQTPPFKLRPSKVIKSKNKRRGLCRVNAKATCPYKTAEVENPVSSTAINFLSPI